MFGPKLVHHHPEEGTRLARVKPDRGTSRTSLQFASDTVSVDPAHGGLSHLTTPALSHPRPAHPLSSCSRHLHRSCLWWPAPLHCALVAVRSLSSPSAFQAATTIIGPGPLTLLSPHGTSPQSPPLSGTWPSEPLLHAAAPAGRMSPHCHHQIVTHCPPYGHHRTASQRSPTPGSNPHSALPYP